MDIKRIDKRNELDIVSLERLILESSVAYQVEIYSVAYAHELQSYLETIQFIVYQMNDNYVAILTYDEVLDRADIHDLVIFKNNKRESPLIWSKLFEEMKKYHSIRFTTYKFLFGFYRKKISAVEKDGVLYWFNWKYLKERNSTRKECQIITYKSIDLFVLRKDEWCEISELKSGNLVGLKTPEISILLYLKLVDFKLVLIIEYSSCIDFGVEVCQHMKRMNSGENKEIVIPLPNEAIEAYDEQLFVNVMVSTRAGKYIFTPGRTIRECIEIAKDRKINVLLSEKLLTVESTEPNSKGIVLKYHWMSNESRELLVQKYESKVYIKVMKEYPVIQNLIFKQDEYLLARCKERIGKNITGIFPIISLARNNCKYAMENLWKKEEAHVECYKTEFMRIEIECSINCVGNRVRINYIFRNNGEEDIECELMQMFFLKEDVELLHNDDNIFIDGKKIIINQKLASYDWGEKKHIPVVEKKFVVERKSFSSTAISLQIV